MPSLNPTLVPTIQPTNIPIQDPTITPTKLPSRNPSVEPTEAPSRDPTIEPTSTAPTHTPTKDPTIKPTSESTQTPSSIPTASPTEIPTMVPTTNPTLSPVTRTPTSSPTNSISIATIGGSGIPGYSGDDGDALSARFNVSYDIVVDSTNRKYFTDTLNNCVRMIDADNSITTIIGTGVASYSGDSGTAASATLNNPYGLCIDSGVNIYIADTYNQRVRLVTTSKLISTVIGTGDASFCGDFSDSLSACLNYPMGVAVDTSGNIYVADTFNHRIRRRNTDGYFYTVAGSSSVGGFSDNRAATSAKLNYPTHIAIDSSGNIFIADSNNHRIRKVTSSTGIISTIAGTGDDGFSGDGFATTTTLNYPYSCAVDATGTVYIADSMNHRVRIIRNSYVITIAGDGSTAYNGDQALATNASINNPTGLYIKDSNLYFLDAKNYYIRQLAMVYSPSPQPTLMPTYSAGIPTFVPSRLPSAIPSIKPSRQPSTWKPSKTPTNNPTIETTLNPSVQPSSYFPSETPTTIPSTSPSIKPIPDVPTNSPSSALPTSSAPSTIPSSLPTYDPSYRPSKEPTYEPTHEPTYLPGEPTPEPSTKSPTVVPTFQHDPTSTPTGHPTGNIQELYFFSVSQQLIGLNVEEWSSSTESSVVFKATVASLIEGSYPSMIEIVSIFDKTVAQSVHAMCVNYTVSFYDTSTYTTIKDTLITAVNSGAFDTALHTYAAASGSSVLQSAQSAYIFVSAASSYIPGPTIKPTVEPASSATSNSAAAAAASTILLLCCFGSTGYWLFRRYKRKKAKDEAFQRWNETYKNSSSTKPDDPNNTGVWTSYLTGIPHSDNNNNKSDGDSKEMNYNPMLANKNNVVSSKEPVLMIKKFVEMKENRLSEDDTTSVAESVTTTSSRRTKSVFASLKARNKLGGSPMNKTVGGAQSSSDEGSISPSIVTVSTVRNKQEIKENSTLSPIHAAAFRRASIDPKRRTSVISSEKQKESNSVIYSSSPPPVTTIGSSSSSINNNPVMEFGLNTSPESIKIRRNSTRITSPSTNSIIPLNVGSERMDKWRKAKEELFERNL